MEYTVTVRAVEDVKTLEQWATDEFRDGRPTEQLNYEIRKLLQERAKVAGTPSDKPRMPKPPRHRGARAVPDSAHNGTVPALVGGGE